MVEILDKVDIGSYLLSLGPRINNEKKAKYKARQNEVNIGKAIEEKRKKLSTPKSILNRHYMCLYGCILVSLINNCPITLHISVVYVFPF